MPPARYPLSIYRGDCESWSFLFYTDSPPTIPYDLTGATAKAEVRYKPSGALIATLDAVITLPNQVTLSIEDEETELLDPAKGVWDLQITDATGCVHTLVAGPATITADVTDSVMV